MTGLTPSPLMAAFVLATWQTMVPKLVPRAEVPAAVALNGVPVNASRAVGPALSGDGGLAMLPGELLTVAQYQLPVKIVVFNNHRLGRVQLEQEAAGHPAVGGRPRSPRVE